MRLVPKHAETVFLAGLALVLSGAAAAGPPGSADPPRRVGDLARALQRQFLQCWNPPLPSNGSTVPAVTLQVHLTIEGEVVAPPVMVSKLDAADPVAQEAIERATAAINHCAPYKLPADRYETWRVIDVTFDPRQMLPSPP